MKRNPVIYRNTSELNLQPDIQNTKLVLEWELHVYMKITIYTTL
jgi:hypothetical protein